MYCAAAVARVRHRRGDVLQAGLDFALDLRNVARGEVVRDRAFFAAVRGPPFRRQQPVLHARLHDAREVEVVAADRHRDELDVVTGGEVLQHQGLPFVAARVVEVEPGLEQPFGREARGLGPGAGEVLAVDRAPDVDLGRLGAVAAFDQFAGAGGVVVIGARAERVDLGGAAVRVAGPASGLAGDVGVAEADRPWRT